MSTFSIDARARSRVSQITTLLDGKLLGSDDTDLFQNIGTGSIVWGENKKNMSVTATTQMITEGTGRVVCAVPVNVAGSTDIIRENFLSFLSSNIDNTMDEYVLAYMPTTNNQTVNGVLTIKEY